MWIQSKDDNIDLGRNVWVSLNHITHFVVRELPSQGADLLPRYGVEAYLDASKMAITSIRPEFGQDQTSILVFRGTEKKCQRFIKRKLWRQSLWQWIGYLVAGLLGAVLAAVITVVLTLKLSP